MISLDSAYRRDIAKARSPLAFALKQWWKDDRPWQPLEQSVPTGSVFVYANHGYWKVDCPVCDGSLLASRIDPRFVCVDCGAGPINEVWPDDLDRLTAALDVRPSANRNWTPAETVDELEAETSAWLLCRMMAGA